MKDRVHDYTTTEALIEDILKFTEKLDNMDYPLEYRAYPIKCKYKKMFDLSDILYGIKIIWI